MAVKIKLEARGSDPGKSPRQDLPVMKGGLRDGFGTYTTSVDTAGVAFMVKGYDSEGRPHGAEVTVDGTKTAAENVSLIATQAGNQSHNKAMLTFPPMVRLAGSEVQPSGVLLIRFSVEESITGAIPASKPTRTSTYKKPVPPALEDVRGGMALEVEAPLAGIDTSTFVDVAEPEAPARPAAALATVVAAAEGRWSTKHVLGALGLGALLVMAFRKR
jgi:hypothetical protein